MSEASRLIAEALEVLGDADRAAAITRAEADRYARQRVAEADMLFGRARRLLAAAEMKASLIVATAGRLGADPVATDAGAPDVVIDLDAFAAELAGPVPDAAPSEALSGLDRLIEAAVGRAVTHAFPERAAR